MLSLLEGGSVGFDLGAEPREGVGRTPTFGCLGFEINLEGDGILPGPKGFGSTLITSGLASVVLGSFWTKRWLELPKPGPSVLGMVGARSEILSLNLGSIP